MDLLRAFEKSSSLGCIGTESSWKSQEIKMLCFTCTEMNHFNVQNFILAEITYQI